MTRDIHLPTVSETHDEPIRSVEDRPLSFGAPLVGFVLSTALTSTLMVLLSQ
jgi:hypothetical protein